MKGFFQDQNGNFSSKRLFSFILILCGIGFGLTAGIIALSKPLGDADFIKSIVAAFIYAGSGVSISSVAEFFKK